MTVGPSRTGAGKSLECLSSRCFDDRCSLLLIKDIQPQLLFVDPKSAHAYMALSPELSSLRPSSFCPCLPRENVTHDCCTTVLNAVDYPAFALSRAHFMANQAPKCVRSLDRAAHGNVNALRVKIGTIDVPHLRRPAKGPLSRHPVTLQPHHEQQGQDCRAGGAKEGADPRASGIQSGKQQAWFTKAC